MVSKFPEAEKRLFSNVYVCRKCKAKIRTQNVKNARCRKCKSKDLRPKRKIMIKKGVA
jgi:ribosomal protein L40E